MCKKVNVILSTYNGERYLRKLLDSIVAQDYPNIQICIRDDGSTDNTKNIIQEYVEAYDNIQFIDETGNLGVPKSFYSLLKKCNDADYYAFADQDDIWENKKISRAVEKLEKFNSILPNMYCASFDYVDNNGDSLRQFSMPVKVDIYNSLYYTPALGFTLVFNEALRKMAVDDIELIDRDFYGELHDRRLIRIAAIWGNVICDNYVCAKHIRHEEAVTSADSTNWNLVKNWIKNEILGEDIIKQKKGIQLFYEDYKSILDEKEKNIMDLFVQNGNRIKKIFFSHRLRSRASGELALRLLFFIGKI